MTVETQVKMIRAVTDGVKTVLIRDSFGNPVLLVKEVEKGTILINRAGEEGFERALRVAGVGLSGVRYKESQVKTVWRREPEFRF
jgi:hypothetical protein